MSQQSFLHGAMILAAAGLLSKLLGVVYRIPFARLVGAEGMGLYQMAYPIYTMVLALATAGLPVAISVLVSEKKAQGDYLGMQKVFRVSLIMLSGVGFLMSLALFHFAGFLAEKVLHDKRAIYSITAISPAIFFSAAIAAFRGFFQGQQWMLPTALSQIIEQVVRVGTVLLAAWWFISQGPEFASAGATFGAVTGGIAGLTVLLIIYIGMQPEKGRLVIPERRSEERMFSLLKRLLYLAGPIALGALVMPIVQTLDAFLVPLRLQQAGYSVQQATKLFGQLSGMAGTLINLPGVITVALGTSLVPAISAAMTRQQKGIIFNRINTGIRVVGLISLPAAVGFYFLAIPICDLLYGLPEAGLPLKALSPAVFFLGLYQVTSASLQGLGYTSLPVRHLIIAGIIKVILNYFLVVQPAFNIQGAGIATGAAFALAAGLNLVSLKRIIGYHLPWAYLLLKPAIAVTIMAVFVNQTYWTLQKATAPNGILTISVIIAGGFIYGLIILVMGGIHGHEIEMIPGIGPQLAVWLRQIRLVRG